MMVVFKIMTKRILNLHVFFFMRKKIGKIRSRGQETLPVHLLVSLHSHGKVMPVSPTNVRLCCARNSTSFSPESGMAAGTQHWPLKQKLSVQVSSQPTETESRTFSVSIRHQERVRESLDQKEQVYKREREKMILSSVHRLFKEEPFGAKGFWGT